MAPKSTILPFLLTVLPSALTNILIDTTMADLCKKLTTQTGLGVAHVYSIEPDVKAARQSVKVRLRDKGVISKVAATISNRGQLRETNIGVEVLPINPHVAEVCNLDDEGSQVKRVRTILTGLGLDTAEFDSGVEPQLSTTTRSKKFVPLIRRMLKFRWEKDHTPESQAGQKERSYMRS